MYFNYKVWLVNEENKKFFGIGPVLLLKKIEKLGSLNKAAIEMNMSYSKAAILIKNAEKELSAKLLVRQVGGKDGGGSYITEEAKELIKKYDEFYVRSGGAIEKIYNEIFQGK
ncbi:winged helix-turn-helix domain-containing protein [Paramaledivibacter caminithermalis]|jgi:molybdate transport system regulatory protein|uniref:Molybdate transport system regulatory protein n=1 Tax=Paramaledivibacter caminithermalis (strain DSM 15212 / CIP 107654 / DViRD3) TaxID=1121301 RepID=A0A1M6K8J3_PARC5|nr:LysR family transcriptional regulator [Paramaledivibacter caminithermalis]SHJ55302.1 molybdate transport system regulatory protein [Paramaledivibacter caminithermalis DSM 15212]